jgi:hypothetical protein
MPRPQSVGTSASPNEIALAAISARTDWDALRSAFAYVLRPGLFEFDNPRQELQQQILRLLDPDEGFSDRNGWTVFDRDAVKEHKWTAFERDCLRWAKIDEVLDRDVPWDAALDVARKELLRGHSAAGEHGTLQRAYQAVRNLLPETMRRPRRPRGPNRK